jgi:SP family myo-inositol transporter-like MFS transporter 13
MFRLLYLALGDHSTMSEYSEKLVKSEDTQGHVEHTVDYHGLSSIEDSDVSRVAWLIAITVSMGGFLFGVTCTTPRILKPLRQYLGYDAGLILAVLVTLRKDLGHALISNEQDLITSITSGGALVGAIIARLSADKYGRLVDWPLAAT